MKVFIKNSSIDGVMDLKDYIEMSNKSKDTFITFGNLKINTLERFGGRIKNPKYIAGVTPQKTMIPLKVIDISKEGLTLELFNKDLKLKEDFHVLLGDDILSIKDENNSRTILNLKTMETIFAIPNYSAYAARLIGTCNTVAVAIKLNGERFEKILFIKDGKLISIVNDVVYAHSYPKVGNFTVIKKANEDKEYIIAMNQDTNSFVQYDSFDSFILPYNSSICNTIMAIKGDSLYKIEDIHKEATLVRKFNNVNIDTRYIEAAMLSCERNIVFIKNIDNSPLINFDGTLIDTDVCNIQKASIDMLLPLDNNYIIYKKNDETEWLYNLSTNTKIEITNLINNNTKPMFSFAVTTVDSHIDAVINSDTLEDYEAQDYINEMFDKKIDELDVILEAHSDLLMKHNLILQQNDNKVSFHSIKDNSVTPLFTKDGEVQFFNCFKVESDDDGNLILIMLSTDYTDIECLDKYVGHIKTSTLIKHATSVEALIINDTIEKANIYIEDVLRDVQKDLEFEQAYIAESLH